MEATVANHDEPSAVRGPGRSLWIVLGAIILLLAAGLASTLVVVRSHTVSYPPSSPQGTVQRYLQLLQTQQVQQAYDMTTGTESRSGFHNEYDNWGTRSHNATLVGSRISGNTTTVAVDFSSFDAGPFGASTDSQRVTFTLERRGHRWLIDDPPYLPY